MNREIFTQRKVDEKLTALLSIQTKINKTLIGGNPSQGYFPKGLAIHTTAQTPSNSAATVQDLLNGDLEDGSDEVAKIAASRVQTLEEIKAGVQQGTPPQKDGYADKLVKYLPSEVIAFYLGLTAILVGETSPQKIYYVLTLIIIGLVATFLYLKSVWKIKSNIQVMLSCIAFLAWALSFDGELGLPGTFQALLLPIVTFLLPLIDPPT